MPNLKSESYKKAVRAGFPEAQCTWYAWGRAHEKHGVSLKVRGNAGKWLDTVQEEGYVVVYEDGYYPDSVGVFPNHVIFIEDINYRSGKAMITYTEANVPQNNILDETDGHEVTETISKIENKFGKLKGCIAVTKQTPNTGAR